MDKKLSMAISIARQCRYVTKAVDIHYPAIDIVIDNILAIMIFIVSTVNHFLSAYS